ncbi:MAG: T9SS type A sorting domain-containing protein [Bacteroidota bacterium]|nr:T9SS type A sorting domain-containing protein [Bacteroidota bacterium]
MKTILALLLAATALAGQAQVTLTRSNSGLEIGDQYAVKTVDPMQLVTNIDPTITGANHTWDFSDMNSTFLDGAISICVDPETTPFIDSLDHADICIKTKDQSEGPYQYFVVTDQQMELVGMGWQQTGNTSFTSYHEGLTALQFPSNYEDAYTDNYVAEMITVAHGLFMLDTATMSIVADGYGTLITPETTYNNVLRLKRTTISQSYTIYDGEIMPTGTHTTIEYQWFKPETPMPVMNIIEMLGLEGYTVTYQTDQNASSIEFLKTKDLGIKIYPNPCTDLLTIDLGDTSFHSLRIFDYLGRMVLDMEQRSSCQAQLYTNFLSPGQYTLQIGSKDQIINKLFIKQ